MAITSLGTSLSVVDEYTIIRLKDSTDYPESPGIASYEAVILVPGEDTPVTIDVQELQGVSPTDTTERTYDITPSDLGLTGSYFTDGIYQITIKLRETGSSTYVEKDLTTFMDRDVKRCIQKKIGNFVFNQSNCNKQKKTDIKYQINEMKLMLDTIYYNVSCNRYAEAQKQVESLTSYCETCDCGC